jgi:Tol biopolymer transport system component
VDSEVAFSPDGRAVAYGRCEGGIGGGDCDVYVQKLDPKAHPEGAARRLTHQSFYIHGLAWTRDGRSIAYGDSTAPARLWRVPADGSRPPERVELAGLGAIAPATTPAMGRLVFTRVQGERDIRGLRLGGTSEPLVASAATEENPQYSPDGRRVAFTTTREGEGQEVWLAEADGSNPTRLTRGPGASQGSPRWSPDGKTIAFDSRGEAGRRSIWTIGVDGFGLRRVTSDEADENMPSWSRDGRVLYYGSNRTGRDEIWRVPVAGGTEEQVQVTGCGQRGERRAATFRRLLRDARLLPSGPGLRTGSPLGRPRAAGPGAGRGQRMSCRAHARCYGRNASAGVFTRSAAVPGCSAW